MEGHNEGDIAIASTSTGEKPLPREEEEEEEEGGNDIIATATATADEQPSKGGNEDDVFDGKRQPWKQCLICM